MSLKVLPIPSKEAWQVGPFLSVIIWSQQQTDISADLEPFSNSLDIHTSTLLKKAACQVGQFDKTLHPISKKSQGTRCTPFWEILFDSLFFFSLLAPCTSSEWTQHKTRTISNENQNIVLHHNPTNTTSTHKSLRTYGNISVDAPFPRGAILTSRGPRCITSRHLQTWAQLSHSHCSLGTLSFSSWACLLALGSKYLVFRSLVFAC